MSKRLVRVIIIDMDEDVPLEHSILHMGEEMLTDLNNQEMFFELDMKGMLAKHNKKRITFVDKDASEGSSKDVMLEPARIRDLVMNVINVFG